MQSHSSRNSPTESCSRLNNLIVIQSYNGRVRGSSQDVGTAQFRERLEEGIYEYKNSRRTQRN